MALDIATFKLILISKGEYRMSFGFGRSPKTISGIEKLSQHVVKMLLTSPGSVARDPTVGGGILRLFTLPTDTDDHQLGALEQDLAIGISQVEDNILEGQESVPLPSDERLQDLRLDQLEFDVDSVTWTFRIRVISEAGSEFALDLSDLLKEG